MRYEGTGPEQAPDELQLRAFEGELLRVHGPLPPPASCPIGWQPTALTPVFYGVRDYDPSPVADPGLSPGPVPERPPARLRVFFPSLDGAVFDAAILEGCGRYPLILLAHGHCQGDANQFLKWFQLPVQLARSGYVVVVPQLTGIGDHPSSDQTTQQTLADTLRWMRESWEHRATLLPAPATGLAGHRPPVRDTGPAHPDHALGRTGVGRAVGGPDRRPVEHRMVVLAASGE